MPNSILPQSPIKRYLGEAVPSFPIPFKVPEPYTGYTLNETLSPQSLADKLSKGQNTQALLGRILKLNPELAQHKTFYSGVVIRIPQGLVKVDLTRQLLGIPEQDNLQPPKYEGLGNITGLDKKNKLYIVQPGDSIFKIAKKLGVEPAYLLRCNPAFDRKKLCDGQVELEQALFKNEHLRQSLSGYKGLDPDALPLNAIISLIIPTKTPNQPVQSLVPVRELINNAHATYLTEAELTELINKAVSQNPIYPNMPKVGSTLLFRKDIAAAESGASNLLDIYKSYSYVNGVDVHKFERLNPAYDYKSWRDEQTQLMDETTFDQAAKRAKTIGPVLKKADPASIKPNDKICLWQVNKKVPPYKIVDGKVVIEIQKMSVAAQQIMAKERVTAAQNQWAYDNGKFELITDDMIKIVDSFTADNIEKMSLKELRENKMIYGRERRSWYMARIDYQMMISGGGVLFKSLEQFVPAQTLSKIMLKDPASLAFIPFGVYGMRHSAAIMQENKILEKHYLSIGDRDRAMACRYARYSAGLAALNMLRFTIIGITKIPSEGASLMMSDKTLFKGTKIGTILNNGAQGMKKVASAYTKAGNTLGVLDNIAKTFTDQIAENYKYESQVTDMSLSPAQRKIDANRHSETYLASLISINKELSPYITDMVNPFKSGDFGFLGNTGWKIWNTQQKMNLRLEVAKAGKITKGTDGRFINDVTGKPFYGYDYNESKRVADSHMADYVGEYPTHGDFGDKMRWTVANDQQHLEAVSSSLMSFGVGVLDFGVGRYAGKLSALTHNTISAAYTSGFYTYLDYAYYQSNPTDDERGNYIKAQGLEKKYGKDPLADLNPNSYWTTGYGVHLTTNAVKAQVADLPSLVKWISLITPKEADLLFKAGTDGYKTHKDDAYFLRLLTLGAHKEIAGSGGKPIHNVEALESYVNGKFQDMDEDSFKNILSQVAFYNAVPGKNLAEKKQYLVNTNNQGQDWLRRVKLYENLVIPKQRMTDDQVELKVKELTTPNLALFGKDFSLPNVKKPITGAMSIISTSFGGGKK
jgi:LysM domain